MKIFSNKLVLYYCQYLLLTVGVSAQSFFTPPVSPALCSAATPLTHGVLEEGTIAAVPEGVWFSFVGTGGDLTVTTCTGNSVLDNSVADTFISVYSGSCNALTRIAYNDDGGCQLRKSLVTIPSMKAATYYVQVTHYLFISTTHPGRIFGLRLVDPIKLIDATVPLSLAVVQESEIATVPEGVWFSFSGTGGDLTVTTVTGVPALDIQNPTTDTEITVYSGSCAPLNQIAYNDDCSSCAINRKSSVTIQSVACQKYYVKVTRYSFNAAEHPGSIFGIVVKAATVTAPIASPVANCPVTPPVSCSFTAPVATPSALVAPPVVPPVVPPVTPPVAPPVAPPVVPPVAPPVAPPIEPPVVPPIALPVALPVEPPIAPPIAPPVVPPVAPPVVPPVAPPVTPPIAPPVNPPVEPPIAPPVTPPVAPPVTPPVAPPVAPPVLFALPVAPPISPPVVPPVAPPVALPVTRPVAPPIEPLVALPVAPNVAPPVAAAPVAPQVAPPVTPAVVPLVAPVNAPIRATITTPSTGGDTSIVPIIVGAILSILGTAVAIVFCIW